MKPIIQIEGLGKKYRIGAQREPYLSLRDSLARRTKGLIDNVFRCSKHTKHYSSEDFWALKDLSFSVQKGEAVGIIGRNGAGKSTLLKILSQITPPTEGMITCRGCVASLLEVGTGFHPELTGRENIFLNGAILGMTRFEIRKKFDEIVAFAEVEKFLDTPVKRYSSGMYVRLAFSVAAHLEPDILLVDEVLAVGDAEFQRKCLGKMGEVAKQGRTVLFVSHNMASIKALCDSGLLLERGRLMKHGQVSDCIELYIGARHGGEPIVSHIERSDPRIQVRQISINDCSHDYIELPPEANSLEIIVEGSLNVTLPVELEIRISDIHGIPLAFFSPGHESGETRRLPPGEFVLRYRLRLPRIMKGIYYANLFLTEPTKNGWVDIPRAACISVSGAAVPSGRVVDYSTGAGFIFLESASG